PRDLRRRGRRVAPRSRRLAVGAAGRRRRASLLPRRHLRPRHLLCPRLRGTGRPAPGRGHASGRRLRGPERLVMTMQRTYATLETRGAKVVPLRRLPETRAVIILCTGCNEPLPDDA